MSNQNQPILLIGIGSSGLYILEQVQNFYYENTGKNKPGYVEYLYIETNKDNQPAITALRNEINRVYISLANMKTMIQELKSENGETMNWLPPEDHVLEAGMGAGGIPACGRLALWGRNTDGNNLTQVIKAIKDIFNKVSGPSAKDSNGSEPAVFLTGSLTGGTGSGIYLDLAYLIRTLIPGIKDLYSLLLLPPEPTDIRNNEVIYANSLGAIRALKYYNKAEHAYVAPNNPNKIFKDLPFELTQFISQSYNDSTPQLHTLSGLYKMAGLFLFLNIVGLRAKRQERLVDAKGNMQIGKYGTFGLSAIHYPKGQIQEYLSLNLGIELLERWGDPMNYYQQNQRTPIDNSRITREVNQRFGQFLRTAFENLNAAGSLNLAQDMTKEAIAINKGEKGRPRERLYELFSPANMEGYYSFINNNIQTGMDSLIASISEMVVEDFNRYESLYYTKLQLQAIAEVIKTTLNYWKTIGISSFAAKWSHFLDHQVSWMTQNKYTLLMEQHNVLRERMGVVLDQLKMHLFVNKLIDLRRNILQSETPVSTANLQERVELPTIYQVEEIIKNIDRATGKREDEGKDLRFKSLHKRKAEIEGDMRDQTIPILRIFPSGAFETEVSQSHERYRNDTGKYFPSKSTLIGDRSLWEYLTNSSTSLHRQLYHDCILKFRQELDAVQSVQNYDVSKYVSKYPQTAKKYASKSTSFLLPIRDKTLERSQNIPKVVIGSDRTVIVDVIKLLHEENFYEFDNDGDHIKEIPELKNIMVFYIEQGNYEPLEDISYMEEVIKMDREYPLTIRDMTTTKWSAFRNPYLEQT